MQNWVWGLLGLTLERLLGGPDCFSQSKHPTEVDQVLFF